MLIHSDLCKLTKWVFQILIRNNTIIQLTLRNLLTISFGVDDNNIHTFMEALTLNFREKTDNKSDH